MKTIENYLEDCKAKTGSDYATAKELGVDKSVISSIRRRGAIADENAVKVAELLGIDPGEVLLAAAMARSQGAVRSAWESVSKRAGIAASIALAVILIFQPGNEAAQFANNIHYAKSYRRRYKFCVRAVSSILESMKWHVRKALSITHAGTVAV